MLKLSLKQIKVNFDVCIEETLRQCLVTLFYNVLKVILMLNHSDFPLFLSTFLAHMKEKFARIYVKIILKTN
jgi:hypothetical protein